MNQARKAFFIVIEGLDGTGKSTVARRVARALNEPDCLPGAVKLTFEPHDPSACGIYIRQVLMHRIKASLRTLALAFAMNRADHCNRDIIPFLVQANAKERVVICDRYYLSSLVYQSHDQLQMRKILELNEGVVTPDLTVFLSASSRTCYQRMRLREQSRELFETNLANTRKKYEEAIAILRERGEKIVEISAEGSLGDVVVRVLDALILNSPTWLGNKIHPRLISEDSPDVLNEATLTLEVCNAELENLWNTGPISSSAELEQRVDELRGAAQGMIRDLSYSELAALFVDILRCENYRVHDRLPWTDTNALELSYELPLGVGQKGAAVFLGKSQRYDAILPNILGNDKLPPLVKMYDFIVILDSNPLVLHSTYYERDQVLHDGQSNVSPSIRVFGREHIASRVVSRALQSLSEEFLYTLRGDSDIRRSFHELKAQYADAASWTPSAVHAG